jgi:hypothetical protein
MDYMSKFDFDTTYVKRELNKVADHLSRYYESDMSADIHDIHEYMYADAHIDLQLRTSQLSKCYHEVTSNIIELHAF